MTYKIIYFGGDKIAEARADECIPELLELIKDSDLLTTNYGYTYSKDLIKGVGDSLRGPTVEYKDGNMDYYYSIECGWKIDNGRK